MPRLSLRAASVEPFWAMEVLERARALERAGAPVLHLEIGEPDFPAPAAAVEACRRALAEGDARYTDSRGLPELRAEIARACGRRSAAPPDPDCVVVTSGVSPALTLVLALLLDPGDEVVLGTPHYAAYPNIIRALGGTPVLVPTHASDGYRLDPDAVRAALGARTRAILVSSPANPTGAVQPREVLEALAALGPALVSDEIYADLVYDAPDCASALGISSGADVFVVDGFSKRYAMTGFRLGYAIAPPWAARALQSLAQNLFISASSFVQRAGLAALRHASQTPARMRAALADRRLQMLQGVRRLGLEVPVAPAGAFYVFADARREDPDSRRLAFRLLEDAHVALAPGVDFGRAGEGHLRFSYTATAADIAEALLRLEKVLGRA